MSTHPIVIVGGGIVGTSIAYYLRDADRPVVLYEKNQLGSGTTSDSISIFIHHQEHPTETEYQLRMRAWESFYEPLIEDGTLGFNQIGTLHTANTESGMAEVEGIATALDSYGVETDLLAPEDLGSFGITPDSVRGALYVPADGAVDPTEIIQYFVEHATAGSVTVETGVSVTDVLTDEEGVMAVETSEGTVPASAVVNAAGPWASRINDMVGVSLPLRHTFGPILVLEKPPDLTLPLTFFEEGYYLCEESETRAFAGKFAVEYQDAFEIDPDHAHAIESDFYLAVEELTTNNVPALAESGIVNEWKGIRTITPDYRPFVGETAVDGYYVACGMGGYGITRAPIVGSVLAEIILGGESEEFGEYLSPDRMV